MALAHRRLDTDAMLGEMSAMQLAEWMAYFEAEPHGEERTDLQTALICQTFANFSMNAPATPARLRDFMLSEMLNEPAPISEEEIERRITHFMSSYEKKPSVH